MPLSPGWPVERVLAAGRLIIARDFLYPAGVGKTTLAIEVAYALGAVLIDLDHDAGGATASWPEVGILAPEFARRALLYGDGPAPRVLNREGLPALIPAHPDAVRPTSTQTSSRSGSQRGLAVWRRRRS